MFGTKKLSLGSVWTIWRYSNHRHAKNVLPSLKLTYPLKIDPWKRRFLLETIIFRCYVNFREGKKFKDPLKSWDLKSLMVWRSKRSIQKKKHRQITPFWRVQSLILRDGIPFQEISWDLCSLASDPFLKPKEAASIILAWGKKWGCLNSWDFLLKPLVKPAIFVYSIAKKLVFLFFWGRGIPFWDDLRVVFF